MSDLTTLLARACRAGLYLTDLDDPNPDEAAAAILATPEGQRINGIADEAITNILVAARLVEALRWCAGSDDFAPGGKARLGWERLAQPAIDAYETLPDATRGQRISAVIEAAVAWRKARRMDNTITAIDRAIELDNAIDALLEGCYLITKDAVVFPEDGLGILYDEWRKVGAQQERERLRAEALKLPRWDEITLSQVNALLADPEDERVGPQCICGGDSGSLRTDIVCPKHDGGYTVPVPTSKMPGSL